MVQIAGTNGKGSTAATLAAILQAAGYRVGLFTSPHLVEYRERFQIQGQAVSDEVLAPLLAQLLDLGERMERGPLFFDITTALAVLLFRQAEVDIAIMEAGLGGRYDQTTALPAIASVITSIGLDHCELLGSTLEAIASEKAGILRLGVPAFFGEIDPSPLAVLLDQASAVGASPVWVVGRDGRLDVSAASTQEADAGLEPWEGGPRWDFVSGEIRYEGLSSSLVARYQRSNLALAIAVSLGLKAQGFAVTEEAIRQGLRDTHWPGRLQRLEWKGHSFWLDGAHNPDGVVALLASLPPDRPLHLVVGCMQDKDIRALFRGFSSRVSTLDLCEIASPRGAKLALLSEIAASCPDLPPARLHRRVEEALSAAFSTRTASGIVLVSGSLVLVGEVLAWHRQTLASSKTPDTGEDLCLSAKRPLQCGLSLGDLPCDGVRKALASPDDVLALAIPPESC